jgi:hypothetical protein
LIGRYPHLPTTFLRGLSHVAYPFPPEARPRRAVPAPPVRRTVVKDANGQALTYMYFEKESRRRNRRELLTRDEARRIAAVFAKLPEILSKRRPIPIPDNGYGTPPHPAALVRG